MPDTQPKRQEQNNDRSELNIVSDSDTTIGGDVVGRDKITSITNIYQTTSIPPSPDERDAPIPGEPPFKGLQYFDEDDASLFFGRELLTAKLVSQLREHHFLAVVGASGSGKSSLVRAGLIPALKRGESLADTTRPPSGSTHWPVHVITPTAHPLEAMAASLTRDSESVTATATLIDDFQRDPRSLHLYVRKLLGQGGGNHLLLIVDQFEELFTACKDDAERQAFVDNMMTAVALETSGPTIVVITLRADFYAHCAQFDALREALSQW